MKAPRRLPNDFSESAAYPLYAIDPAQDRAWILHFEREDYRRASFLDKRALGHREISGWEVSGPELHAALSQPRSLERLNWLFHVGHCGSTLVSRLLDLVPGTLGIREPLPLLTLAHGAPGVTIDHWLLPTRNLLARGFKDTRAVVVKPTSVVTTIADQLLPGTGQACLLWVDLKTWLATMLRSGELMDSVLATEHLRLAGNPTQLSPETTGARLARIWLVEQLRWRQLTRSPEVAPRMLDLDFADVMADPAGGIRALASHFGLVLPNDWEALVVESGVLDHYAKDASQSFNPQTRRRELTEASERHSDAISEGLKWAQAELERRDAAFLAARLSPTR